MSYKESSEQGASCIVGLMEVIGIDHELTNGRPRTRYNITRALPFDATTNAHSRKTVVTSGRIIAFGRSQQSLAGEDVEVKSSPM